jgi:hypothetical protein
LIENGILRHKKPLDEVEGRGELLTFYGGLRHGGEDTSGYSYIACN